MQMYADINLSYVQCTTLKFSLIMDFFNYVAEFQKGYFRWCYGDINFHHLMAWVWFYVQILQKNFYIT